VSAARFYRPVAVALVLLGAIAANGAHAGPQIFLVQNSGWMEPFYTDPASQYKPLVGALVAAATAPGDPYVLAAFNQGTAQAPSPRALLSARAGAASATQAQVAQALASLSPAK
jgi:hypothetical protein